MVKSVHYCEKTSQLHTRTYQDSFSSLGAPTTTAYPTKVGFFFCKVIVCILFILLSRMKVETLLLLSMECVYTKILR